MNFEDLAPELQKKAKACKSPEELLALAKAEGYELSDAELEQVAGGGFWDDCGDQCLDKDRCHQWIIH